MSNVIARSFIATAAAALLVSAPAFGETAGEYIDDATIGASTKAALVEDKTAPAGDINVEVHKGIVQLSGFVGSDAEEAAALAVAANIDGVKKVLDAIVVMPGDRSMGEAVDDTAIQAKLKTELASVAGFGDAVAVNTEVRQGHVILAGFVDSSEVKNNAGKAAEGIKGVTKVHNYISVQAD